MDDREPLLDTLSWHPPEPLTVVVAEADVADLAENLTRDGWWRFDDRLSANGIHIDAWAEKNWNADPLGARPHPNEGTAWMQLRFTGYTLACDVRRDTARDVAAGLTGESSVTVPVLFNCEPEDEDWLPDPVAVYFTSEESSQHVFVNLQPPV